MAKILDTEGLNRLGADVREMIAKVSVPTITIALSQVVGQSPLQIQLTNEQYDALAASQVAVVDATALGISTLISVFKMSEDDSVINFRATGYTWSDGIVAGNEAYAFNIVKSTKRLTRYGGKFYSIPMVTITADNIDQSTGTITLTSEQFECFEGSFAVIINAGILGLRVQIMYRSNFPTDDGNLLFSTAMGSYYDYRSIRISEDDYSVRLYSYVGTGSHTVLIGGSDEYNNVVSANEILAAVTGYDSFNIASGGTIPSNEQDLMSAIEIHLPIKINGALCHYMDENTTTNIVRYFTATMNGALVHLNIIEINTSTWVVTFNQVDVGASPNVDQDLTTNTCFTLDATAFASLVSTHTATVASPVFTGLSNTYEFVTIKASINSTNYNIKLCRNDTGKYSGLFFIEDSSHLYELTLYYNGTSVYLRCATVY